MQFEVDTIQEEKTRLLDQANIMQKENSDIAGEKYNILANHAREEEEILNIETMDLENIKAIEETSKKNDKATKEKDDLASKIIPFHWINKKYLNNIENSSGQVPSFQINLKGLNNENHHMK